MSGVLVGVTESGVTIPEFVVPEFSLFVTESSEPVIITGDSVVSPEREITTHVSEDISTVSDPVEDITSSVTETIGALESETTPVATWAHVSEGIEICSVVEIFSPVPISDPESTTFVSFCSSVPVLVVTGIISIFTVVSGITAVLMIGCFSNTLSLRIH